MAEFEQPRCDCRTHLAETGNANLHRHPPSFFRDDSRPLPMRQRRPRQQRARTSKSRRT
jgi:hypothetical protein